MTESPKYSIIKNENAIELRQYPALIKAEVEVEDSTYREAINKGFRILAGYIFGANYKTKEIAMTSPVQVSQSQTIAMTKPVTISGDETYTVAFIMPSEYTLETLPKPEHPAIRLSIQESQTIAAIRFSGFFRRNQVEKAQQRLTSWLEKEGLEMESGFIAAGYNPPWVPKFLARDEVMVRVRMNEA